MEQTPVAISVHQLQKRFSRSGLGKSRYTTFKSLLVSLFRKESARVPAEDSFAALRDVTFNVPKGSCVGIVGRNGCGKSTLLKLITGIYRPDAGTISVNGTVRALIELGAGFHPDFTGRENLFLAGTLYGLSRKDLEERFDAIVAFAELEAAIDQPVRTYSSGMFMRLGFSIAVHTDPDILIIDEVLAVGDAAFVSKCKACLQKFQKQGKTLLLVSHDLDTVSRWCDQVIWIDQGKIAAQGAPAPIIAQYLASLDADLEKARSAEETRSEERWGNKEVEITAVALHGSLTPAEQTRHIFHTTEAVEIVISFKAAQPLTDVVFGIGVASPAGMVYGTNTAIEKISMAPLPQEGTITFSLPRLSLLEGQYHLDVACHRVDGAPYDYREGIVSFSVHSTAKEVGNVSIPHRWSFSW